MATQEQESQIRKAVEECRKAKGDKSKEQSALNTLITLLNTLPESERLAITVALAINI